jgi:hypothetical protein
MNDRMAPSLEEAERRLAGTYVVRVPLPTSSSAHPAGEVMGPFEYTVPGHWIAPTNDKGLVGGAIAWMRPCKPESGSNTIGRLVIFILIGLVVVPLFGPAMAVVLLFWWTIWVIVRIFSNLKHQKKVLQERRDRWGNSRVR